MISHDALLRRLTVSFFTALPLFPLLIVALVALPQKYVFLVGWLDLRSITYVFIFWLLSLSFLLQLRVFCGNSGLHPGQIWRHVVFLHVVFIVPFVFIGPVPFAEGLLKGSDEYLFTVITSLTVLFVISSFFCFSEYFGIVQIRRNMLMYKSKTILFLLLIFPGFVSIVLSFIFILAFLFSI